MLQSRLLWKLYAGYGVLILISGVITGLLVAGQVERDMLEEIRTSLRSRATMLREVCALSLTGRPDPRLQERVRSLGSETHTRLTVIRKDGSVAADSEEDPSRMHDHSNRPEILAAAEKGVGIATRFSNTINKNMLYVALPVRSEGQLVGYVRAALSLVVIDERLAGLRGAVALGSVLAALLALVVGFFMARSFVRPLSSMTAVAEAMAGGDYARQIPITTQDEVGELARAVNQIARRSQQRMETITTDYNELRAILSGMVEGVVAIDREEQVVHINGVAAKIFRTVPDKAIGKKIWEVSRVPEIGEALTATLKDDKETRRELRIVSRPRDQVIDIHASPLRNGDGELVGAVVVLHDVTELNRLETVRRDFVANVSHELKTPITAIRGLVETLIDDRNMDEKTRKRFLAKILDQSLRLSTLVTDLLALSRLESEEGALEWGHVDLRDSGQAAARALLPAAEERGITVQVSTPDNPLDVHGDAEALRQVATNLLDNALKYTPRQGRVWLRLYADGGNAVLEVEDTGIGIEPRHQDRLFERFYRVDKARSRELGGTGLGLSIVKHVALVHGGDVSVDSTPGKGSTFRVRIPLKPDSAV